jgi:F-type H+-transporting ATPase subunit epsilon
LSGDATFTVEVLTPEGEVFRGDVISISTKTVGGEIGVLANHVPILAALEPNLLRLQVSSSERVELAQAHGIMQVFGNQAEILVEEAIPVGELDVGSLESQLQDARARAEDETAGEAARAAAEKDLERIEAFLSIAKGS